MLDPSNTMTVKVENKDMVVRMPRGVVVVGPVMLPPFSQNFSGVTMVPTVVETVGKC